MKGLTFFVFVIETLMGSAEGSPGAAHGLWGAAIWDLEGRRYGNSRGGAHWTLESHPITEKYMCPLFLTLYNWPAMKHPSVSLFQLCFWGKGRLLAQLGRRCWGAPHRILTLFNPLWPCNGARTPAIKRLQAGIFQPANQCATATVLKHIRDSHFSNCGDNSQCQMLSHYL